MEIVSTVADKWSYWVSSGVGILGWLDVPIRNSFYFGCLVGAFLLVGWPASDKPWRERVGVAGLAVGGTDRSADTGPAGVSDSQVSEHAVGNRGSVRDRHSHLPR